MLLTERLEEDTGSGEGRKCASSWHVLHPALTRGCACYDILTAQTPDFIRSVSMVYHHQRGGEETGRHGGEELSALKDSNLIGGGDRSAQIVDSFESTLLGSEG